jgi:hypothetical protein
MSVSTRGYDNSASVYRNGYYMPRTIRKWLRKWKVKYSGKIHQAWWREQYTDKLEDLRMSTSVLRYGMPRRDRFEFKAARGGRQAWYVKMSDRMYFFFGTEDEILERFHMCDIMRL